MTRTPIVHRVRAVNTAPESENKIHDDRVAAQFGFRGGLVPGVTVYGYMTAPIIAIAPDWLERGAMQVRFLEPFYDGDEVIAKAEPQDDGSMIVTAERSDSTLCAKGTASVPRHRDDTPALLAEAPLPDFDQRPVPSPDNLVPGAALGTITAPLVSDDPAKLLQYSNDLLVRNFKLGPWIHVSSEIVNCQRAHPGEEISARARIHDRFERKGHQFVVVDVMLLRNANELIQTVRHTAIYQLRAAA